MYQVRRVGAEDSGDYEDGEKYAILEEEANRKLTACLLFRSKPGNEHQYQEKWCK